MSAPRYYRARLAKLGPFVGVKVWHGAPFIDGDDVDRSPRWQALVSTETTARAVLMGEHLPVEVDGVTLRNLEPIAEHEYRFMVADAAHARDWRPDHPKAEPRKAVDYHSLKPRF